MDVCDLSGHDPVQVLLMEEMCILVDYDDNVIGSATKRTTHLMRNIDRGMLHRAFSVFLFDEDYNLLLQQRSDKKITFPMHWTNTCCSHPLAVPDELEEKDQLGVKRAARRKLWQELGICESEVPLENFIYLSRVHYSAASDSKWGEHEVDYVLFIKGNFFLKPNPNEVNAVKYTSQDELREMVAKCKSGSSNIKFTPWFAFIANNHLFEWWNALIDGTISKYSNGQIYRTDEVLRFREGK